jgi:hypothetical protein
MGKTWIIIALAAVVVGLMIVVAAHGDECAPCMIVGSITETNGSVVEQFKYPFGYPTSERCEAERASENFQSAMTDLKARAEKLGILGKEFQNLTVEAACVSADTKPAHP